MKRTLWKTTIPLAEHADYTHGDDRFQVEFTANADLVSSLADDGLHYPVLDLDFPCRLTESETRGHFHLQLDLPEGLTWRKYRRLLRALRKAGVIEPGYYRANVARRATFIALRPWKDVA